MQLPDSNNDGTDRVDQQCVHIYVYYNETLNNGHWRIDTK